MEKLRVFVTRELPGGALKRLAEAATVEVWGGDGAPNREELIRGAQDAAGLLCLLTDPVDADTLAACPGLRVISSCSVGLDHVDLAAAGARGIPVGHTPGVLAETTAELAFGLMLAAARRIAEADRYVRAGRWTPERAWSPDMLLGRDLHGATLGVLGLGQTGQAVARRANAFGMRVLGWTRSGRRVAGVEAAPLDTLLREADFISIHLALSAETRGSIGRAELESMKPGAILVNTARGGIVDEPALADALRNGPLAAAGMDVFASEPIPADHPFLSLENVVLTPHIGSASVRTRARMAELAVDNLLAGLAGQRMPHCANPEIYERSSSGGS